MTMQSINDFQVNRDVAEDDGELPQLPKGDYVVSITDVEDRVNSKNTGRVLVVKMEVAVGDHASRKLADSFNYENENPQTEEIAAKQLSQLCISNGITEFTKGGGELIDSMCIVRLYMHKGETRIGGYRKVGEDEESEFQPPSRPQNSVPDEDIPF